MINFNSRRKFLLGTVLTAGGVAAAVSLKLRLGQSSLKYNEPYTAAQAQLRSIVDTIIPEDESPGALTLMLDKEIEREMQDKPSFDTQIARLLAFVSKSSLSKHHQPFEKLNVDEREALLLEMLKQSTPRRARLDLNQLRRRLLSLYYTNPVGQRSINYLAPRRYPAYSQVR